MARLWTRWRASEDELRELEQAREHAEQQAAEAETLLAVSKEEGAKQRASRTQNHYGEALEWLLTRRAT